MAEDSKAPAEPPKKTDDDGPHKDDDAPVVDADTKPKPPDGKHRGKSKGKGGPKKAAGPASAPAAAAAATSPATAPAPSSVAVMNPTYVDALHYMDSYFRQQGELAMLMGVAARDGLSAFMTRSSHEYNQHSAIAMELFSAAIAVIPAAGVLGSAFHELRTGEKLFGLAKTAKAIAAVGETAVHAEEGAKALKEAVEPAKKLFEAGEKVGDIGKKQHEATEAQERGEFQIEKLNSISDLTAAGIARLWSSQSFMDDLMPGLEYSPPTTDLKKLVKGFLGGLPDPRSLAGAINDLRGSFEFTLYLEYYIKSGKTTYVTTNQDDAISHEFIGMPRAVEDRIRALGKMEKVMECKELKKETRSRHWTSSQF
jgi:hypothetical protein